MAKPMTADQTLAAMKKWRVPFKEYPGWRTNGRPASAGPFDDVRGVIIHHTGSDSGQSDDYLHFLFVTGRPEDGIPGPLCHVATDMDGDLHLGATGRANHAGRGSGAVLAKVGAENHLGFTAELKPGPDDTNGNAYFYGNEVRYDGGQPQTPQQYDSAVRWAAAVCDFHKWSALSVIGHREWTTRKNDPGVCPMTKFRADVAARLKAGPGIQEIDMTLTPSEIQQIADAVWAKMTTSALDGSAVTTLNLLRYSEAEARAAHAELGPVEGAFGALQEGVDAVSFNQNAEADKYAAAAVKHDAEEVLEGQRWAQGIDESRQQAADAQAKLDAILTALQPPVEPPLA